MIPHKIQYWYDRPGGTWITRVADKDNNQIGHCQFSGTKEGMELDIRLFQKEYGPLIIEKYHKLFHDKTNIR
jgi:hypothetical protein